MEVFGSPGGGGIGKTDHPVFFQGDALHFQEGFPVPLFQVEVEPGLVVPEFRLDSGKAGEASLFQPFLDHLVGGLGIHIDEPGAFFHRHQVVSGLPFGIVTGGEVHPGPWDQQFPAASGVLHMAGFFLTIDFHLGDEPVGPGTEGTGSDVGVVHEKSGPFLRDSRFPSCSCCCRKAGTHLCWHCCSRCHLCI